MNWSLQTHVFIFHTTEEISQTNILGMLYTAVSDKYTTSLHASILSLQCQARQECCQELHTVCTRGYDHRLQRQLDLSLLKSLIKFAPMDIMRLLPGIRTGNYFTVIILVY